MLLSDVRITKKGRYSLYVDGEFLFSAHPEVFLRSGLAAGQQVDIRRLEELRLASEERTAKDRALALLSYSCRTEKQLYDKLADKNGSEAAAAAVARMAELGLVDDSDYARRFISDRLNLKDWGMKRIVMELRKKGVDPDVIDKAVQESEYDGRSRLAAVVERRYLPLPADPKEKSRMVQSLMRLGYEYD